MMNESTATVGNIDDEPAKVILEKTDGLLDELANELRCIEEAVFSPKPQSGMPPIQEPDTCLLATLRRQNTAVRVLLEIAIHIRNGLW